MKIKEYYEIWLAERKARVKPSPGEIQAIRTVKENLVFYYGEYDVSEFGDKELAALLKRKGKKYQFCRKYVLVFLRSAAKRGYPSQCANLGCQIKQFRKAPPQSTIPPEHVNALLSVLPARLESILIFIELFNGIPSTRAGALKREQIDLEEKLFRQVAIQKETLDCPMTYPVYWLLLSFDKKDLPIYPFQKKGRILTSKQLENHLHRYCRKANVPIYGFSSLQQTYNHFFYQGGFDDVDPHKLLAFIRLFRRIHEA